jgi:hypothetical protein
MIVGFFQFLFVRMGVGGPGRGSTFFFNKVSKLKFFLKSLLVIKQKNRLFLSKTYQAMKEEEEEEEGIRREGK